MSSTSKESKKETTKETSKDKETKPSSQKKEEETKKKSQKEEKKGGDDDEYSGEEDEEDDEGTISEEEDQEPDGKLHIFRGSSYFVCCNRWFACVRWWQILGLVGEDELSALADESNLPIDEILKRYQQQSGGDEVCFSQFWYFAIILFPFSTQK